MEENVNFDDYVHKEENLTMRVNYLQLIDKDRDSKHVEEPYTTKFLPLRTINLR
ncbi:6353_t:CDS:2 [Funneliformis caledonium]|uniref:6353_t:CDS:1 n=1 Tax=Funneliformis caledonium TaxID=1117310 RepID=A0A9N9ABL9_9GLOM|nr:6353_t:CDS:2 [Funneliformis caledonium]